MVRGCCECRRSTSLIIPMLRRFATMVDVSAKAATHRTAVAQGTIRFPQAVFAHIQTHGSVKGDFVTVAKVAGIQAAKRTSLLLPLCHNLPLDKVSISIAPNTAASAYSVTAEVSTSGKTGVEMEALTAVTAACLTIYDMTKMLSQEIVIERVELVWKTGGKSDYKKQ